MTSSKADSGSILERYGVAKFDTGIVDTEDMIEGSSSSSDRNFPLKVAPCRQCGSALVPYTIKAGRIDSWICPSCESVRYPEKQSIKYANKVRPELSARADRLPFIIESFAEDDVRTSISRSHRTIPIKTSTVTGNKIVVPGTRIVQPKGARKKDTDDKLLESKGLTIVESYEHTSAI